jgi:hypothetical protein
VTAETAVEEYAERLENEFKSSMGAAYDVFKMDAGYGRKQSSEKKKQLRRKLTSIINPELLKSLKDMMTLLSQDSNPDGRQFYLMIDSIDENWIDESVRYKLIRSLIETQKTFRTIPDLKIVIAMRADIFDRALAEASDPSIQRDKLNDYKAEISWTKAELLELVDSRVKELCSRKYTTKGVSFNDIFCTKIDQKTPFNYIVERTLMRPRDMILFVNDCLIQAKGKSTVTKTNIQRAEEKYSRDRKRAMIDEWKSCLPSVELCLNTLRTLPKHLGTYSDFSDSIDWTDLEVRLFEIGDKFGHDPLGKVVHAKGFTTSNLSMKNSLLRVLLSQLYRIGALGIKQSEGSPIQYVFNGPAFVDPDEVTDQLRWYIHKGLRNVLGFRTANDSGRN